jgi:hypothetical protein
MLLWSSSRVSLPPKAAKVFSYFLKGKKRVVGGWCLFFNLKKKLIKKINNYFFGGWVYSFGMGRIIIIKKY